MNTLDTSEQIGVKSDSVPTISEHYRGFPVVFLRGADGVSRPAPFLMNRVELAELFRLQDSGTKFPEKAIQRYQTLGLKAIRIGRRRWYRLDDVLRFLDCQQDRLSRLRR